MLILLLLLSCVSGCAFRLRTSIREGGGAGPPALATELSWDVGLPVVVEGGAEADGAAGPWVVSVSTFDAGGAVRVVPLAGRSGRRAADRPFPFAETHARRALRASLRCGARGSASASDEDAAVMLLDVPLRISEVPPLSSAEDGDARRARAVGGRSRRISDSRLDGADFLSHLGSSHRRVAQWQRMREGGRGRAKASLDLRVSLPLDAALLSGLIGPLERGGHSALNARRLPVITRLAECLQSANEACLEDSLRELLYGGGMGSASVNPSAGAAEEAVECAIFVRPHVWRPSNELTNASFVQWRAPHLANGASAAIPTLKSPIQWSRLLLLPDASVEGLLLREPAPPAGARELDATGVGCGDELRAVLLQKRRPCTLRPCSDEEVPSLADCHGPLDNDEEVQEEEEEEGSFQDDSGSDWQYIAPLAPPQPSAVSSFVSIAQFVPAATDPLPVPVEKEDVSSKARESTRTTRPAPVPSPRTPLPTDEGGTAQEDAPGGTGLDGWSLDVGVATAEAPSLDLANSPKEDEEGAPLLLQLSEEERGSPSAAFFHHDQFSSPRGAGGEVSPLRRFAESQETAFLEAASIPGLSTMIEGFMKLVLAPVFDPFLATTTSHLEKTMGEELSRDISSTVPADTIAKLEPDLRHNLTSLLPPMITAIVAPKLAGALMRTLVAPAAENIIASLEADLHGHLVRKLQALLSVRFDTTLTRSLFRSLRLNLTASVTRIVTHALVPALAGALLPRMLSDNGGASGADGSIPSQSALWQLGVPLAPKCAECDSSPSAAMDAKFCTQCHRDASEFAILYHAHGEWAERSLS